MYSPPAQRCRRIVTRIVTLSHVWPKTRFSTEARPRQHTQLGRPRSTSGFCPWRGGITRHRISTRHPDPGARSNSSSPESRRQKQQQQSRTQFSPAQPTPTHTQRPENRDQPSFTAIARPAFAQPRRKHSAAPSDLEHHQQESVVIKKTDSALSYQISVTRDGTSRGQPVQDRGKLRRN